MMPELGVAALIRQKPVEQKMNRWARDTLRQHDALPLTTLVHSGIVLAETIMMLQ